MKREARTACTSFLNLGQFVRVRLQFLLRIPLMFSRFPEKEQLALFKSIFEHTSDAIYIVDPETSKIIDVNRAGCDDVGMIRSEVLNQSVFTLQQDVLDLKHWKEIVSAIKQAGTFIFVGRHVRKDGSEFPVEVHSNFFEHQGHELLVSIARDISDRMALEDQVRQREPQLSYALNAASDGLWDWNIDTEEVFFSPQLKRMLGYGPHEMKPHISTWQDNVHVDDLEQVFQALQAHLTGKSTRYEAQYRLRNRNGDYIWVHDHGSVCERSDNGEPSRVVGMVRNISKSKDLEIRLEKLAAHDELTGLLNRRAGYERFEKYLKKASMRKQHLSVALLDIDHFKKINDQCGHATGDEVLRQAAQVLLSVTRETDALLRWGGEEFLLIMPNTRIEDGLTLCERVRSQLKMVTESSGSICCTITLSGGIAEYPQHGDDIESLVGMADRAMYKAKDLSRDRIVLAS